jgi:hypothetical protein
VQYRFFPYFRCCCPDRLGQGNKGVTVAGRPENGLSIALHAVPGGEFYTLKMHFGAVVAEIYRRLLGPAKKARGIWRSTGADCALTVGTQ